MTDARGRHSKGQFSGSRYVTSRLSRRLDRTDLLKIWKKMSDLQRESYNYNFEMYVRENGK